MTAKKAKIESVNLCGSMVYRERKPDGKEVCRWYQGAARYEIPFSEFRKTAERLIHCWDDDNGS